MKVTTPRLAGAIALAAAVGFAGGLLAVFVAEKGKPLTTPVK
ncbi:MAG TPA: hypothetical protein VMN04_10095 [Thermoanaerobaculia bacterium]|nr:hypothetical protein [Thermoanaerobaculia bacterium]